MAFYHHFELLQDDGIGPIWRESFADLEPAKQQAQILADAEGIKFLVFSVGKRLEEVARMFPSNRKAES